MNWKSFKLFTLVSTLNGTLLLVGWAVGSLFGKSGWFLGAMIGGIIGIFAAVLLAEHLGFLERASFNAVARFSVCGAGVATIIASMNEDQPVIQVASFFLVGFGALFGKWFDHLLDPKSDPPPSIL